MLGVLYFHIFLLKWITGPLGRGTESFLLDFLIPVLSIYSGHDRSAKMLNGLAG